MYTKNSDKFNKGNSNLVQTRQTQTHMNFPVLHPQKRLTKSFSIDFYLYCKEIGSLVKLIFIFST